MTWLMWDTERSRLVESTFLEELTTKAARDQRDVAVVAFRVVDTDEEARFDFRAYHARQAKAKELGLEILTARDRAHEKHGDDSIEGVSADDPGWLASLVEEVGEIAHALTYDAVVSSNETERLRLRRAALEGELVDVLAVASAWLDASRTGRGLPVDTSRSDAEAADDTRPGR